MSEAAKQLSECGGEGSLLPELLGLKLGPNDAMGPNILRSKILRPVASFGLISVLILDFRLGFVVLTKRFILTFGPRFVAHLKGWATDLCVANLFAEQRLWNNT